MRIISGVLEVAGLTGLGYGLWQYAPWVAWTVIGTIVLIGGIMVDFMIQVKK